VIPVIEMRGRTLVAAAFMATTLMGQAALARGKPQPGGQGPRVVRFAGYDWEVKTSGRRPVGPGPNFFTDDPESVWVDAAGRLHLRIRRAGNRWYAAEVICRASLGHGRYRFVLDSDVDAFAPSVVLGLFTWSDDATDNHREIDVEMARWGNAGDPTNAQFVVQPYDGPDNLVRFAVPAGPTRHSFTWMPGAVAFGAAAGPNGETPIASWVYTGPDVPREGDENPRINLWLFRGAAPADGQPVEVIVRDFVFQP